MVNIESTAEVLIPVTSVVFVSTAESKHINEREQSDNLLLDNNLQHFIFRDMVRNNSEL